MLKKGRSRAALSASTGGASHTRHRLRIRVVLWCFLGAYAVVCLRLAVLQAYPDPKYSHEDSKHVGTIEIPVPRGNIYDSNGVVLATDQTVYSLWADPSRIENAGELASRLSALLDLDPGEIQARLQKSDANGKLLRFSWVKRWLAQEEVSRLSSDGVLKKGLNIRPEPLRFYPQGELAAPVLGFTNLERKGGEGVELQFDKYLSSTPGLRKSRKDARRHLLNSLTLEYQEPEGGDDLYLTIDAALQQTLEAELDKAMEFAKAPSAMGMLMDPRTGAILAMASRPAFNPNRYWEYEPELYMNRAIVDAFEPGSAFKIVAGSAAIEEDLITPETRIDCENGGFNPYGHYIRDYHPLGVEPFTTCFAQSSNVAIIKVGALLGRERMDEWIRRFGFGQRTSRDFPKENPGLHRPIKKWSGLTMGSLPMGQEINVTMPQLARAFAVIANGGYLIEPYVVDRAVGRDGIETYDHIMVKPARILSQETADTMRNLCHMVTLDGTGDRARIDEYEVAGKTGTAQIAKPGRGYVPGLFTAIFAGFAPVKDPRVVAVIIVQEPEIKLHFGGYICGPVFKAVVREALVRMNAPTDAVPEETPAEPVPAEIEAEDPDTILASEPGSEDEPSADAMLGSLDGLELVRHVKDPSGGPVLPDLRGLTKSQARARVVALGLDWDAQGSGWVISQSPEPGTALSDVGKCLLNFSDERPVATAKNETERKNENINAQ